MRRGSSAGETPSRSLPSLVHTLVRDRFVVAAALLMVSRFRYRSFKEFDLRSRRSFVYVLAIAILLVPILAWPEGTLLVLAVVYAGSGPLYWGIGLLQPKDRREREASAAPAEVADGPPAV